MRREPDARLCLPHGAGKYAAQVEVMSVSPFGVTEEHHPLDDICDIGVLIGRDFVFHAEIAPAKPMITEDLTDRTGYGPWGDQDVGMSNERSSPDCMEDSFKIQLHSPYQIE